jgi:hypothetical protein
MSIAQVVGFVKGFFDKRPVRLAIVRRYADANGSFIGELYMYGTFAGIGAYKMVGCSLDTLPLDMGSLSLNDEPGTLDLLHDFLAPMGPNTLRIGACLPEDNEHVRTMVGRIPRRNIHLVIQNKFIEHVMDRRTA